MREDTLTDMVNHMEDDVGLVHQMPFVCDREGFPASLEKVGCPAADAADAALILLRLPVAATILSY